MTDRLRTAVLCSSAALLIAAVPAGSASWAASVGEAAQAAAQPAPPAAKAPPTDLDAFMARVLQRRDENWRKLHDYILSETESFSIDGPGLLPLNGYRREYAWYVRDGYLIRSPVRFDGVAVPETERRKYEENWAKQEKEREARARSEKGKPASGAQAAEAADVPSLQQMVDQRGEPRFISESYFLQFKFEPGNYYLAGREQLEGREVLRIEYYPTGLFGDEKRDRPATGAAAKPAPARPRKPAKSEPAGTDDDEIERKLNKVALVTLWVDPAEHQIVKYSFDNTEFDFLPGRWLIRVDDITASMTMSRVLDGIWLPARISMHAGLAFASGRCGLQYGRTFYDYKKAEVGARFRIVSPKHP